MKWVGSVRRSSKYPTLIDCLRELGRVIRQDHGPTCVVAAQGLQAAEKDAGDVSTKRPADVDEGAASLNATEVLMLNTRLKMIQERATQAKKAVLEAEKERDELHNQIEQIEQWLYLKRAHSHEDGDGDSHEMIINGHSLDIMHGKERTSTGKITSAILVAQHLLAIFSNKDWDTDHADMKIQQVVVLYLNDDESVDHQHPLSFLHTRTSCHVFLLCFLVYRDTMRGGRSAVGARHDRVCVVEDTDPTPVDQIS